MRLCALVLTLALASPSVAQEFIETSGPLSDTAFYRLVACAAPPEENCQKPFVRWPDHKAQRLTVSLRGIDPGFADYKLAGVLVGLDRAIAEINAAGAALHLTRAPDGAQSDIQIFLTGSDGGSRISGTGIPGMDGATIDAGLVVVWQNEGDILGAAIALARDINRRSIAPVLLEELTQSLGLTTDIRNASYRRSTVFSEDGNSVARLGAQDKSVLRLHYPPEGALQTSASR